MDAASPAAGMVCIMDAAEIARTLRRMAHQITERHGAPRAPGLALVGIYTRGVEVARRLADLIEGIEGVRPRVRRA